MRPGPLRLSLENRTDARVLPAVWIAGDELHDLLGRRRPFLTAKRLLTNQTFRDIYRTDTLDVDQRLKITSLTFLFTDLKGSTELYERVGDLVAFDLVRAHFRVLHEIVAAEARRGGEDHRRRGDGDVPDARPRGGRGAAHARRHARLNEERGSEDLLLKIGIHEGPCLAVTLNERQDYFGQTVNIASRVQGLADVARDLRDRTVVEHPVAAKLLDTGGFTPAAQHRPARYRRRDDGVRDSLSGRRRPSRPNAAPSPPAAPAAPA